MANNDEKLRALVAALGHIEKQYGKDEALKAEQGISQNVNILCGMDEIPQLIYASDVVKRNNVYTDIKFYGTENLSSVDSYDVKNANEILNIYSNYVKRNGSEKGEILHMFICDYKNSTSKTNIINE